MQMLLESDFLATSEKERIAPLFSQICFMKKKLFSYYLSNKNIQKEGDWILGATSFRNVQAYEPSNNLPSGQERAIPNLFSVSNVVDQCKQRNFLCLWNII